jgi:undecaprenyl-phosphate 4-deoxy-4-formamido-L-arabinose transferase
MNDDKQQNVQIRSVSVVVPVFNSKGTLKKLVERIDEVLSEYAEAFEIILVNDGSRDSSWEVINDITSQNGNVRGINLMHNYGQHNALLAGIDRTRYDSIITIDDDLQNPPEEIPKLLDKLGEGFDVVYGKPIKRGHNSWRNLGSKILKASLKVVLGAEMGKQSSSFRAFRALMRRGFSNFTDANLALDVLLSWSAARVTNIPVQ